MATEDIKKIISNSVKTKKEQIKFIQDEIIIADDQKAFYDKAIKKIEKKVFNEIEEVNRSFADIEKAYDAAIENGCKSDLFWRLTEFTPRDANSAEGRRDTYTFKCTKLTPFNYDTSVGIGTTMRDRIVYLDPNGELNYFSFDSYPGFDQRDNYGLKYYEEPFNVDIGNTLVGSFIGTCSLGSTKITVMNQTEDNLDFEPGQIISQCTKNNVLSIATKIEEVGIGTTTVNLTPVGIGSTQATVTVLKCNVPMAADATAPESDGSLVGFRVIDDPDDFKEGRKKYKIPFNRDPFNKQTISIASTGGIGVGKSVYLVQNGVFKREDSWDTGDAFKVNRDGDQYIFEPEVGPGRTFFKVGFDHKPININGSDADEGDERIYYGNVLANGTFYEELNSCPSSIVNDITDAIGISSDRETNLIDNNGIHQTLLTGSNALRSERNLISLKIFGMRKILGNENEDIDTLSNLDDILKDPNILKVVDEDD